MNNATRLRRLNHFITVLEAVPEKKLIMASWMEEKYFNKPVDCVLPKSFIKIDCCTVCCALGWAALDKEFKAAGLKVISDTKSNKSIFGEILYKEFESLEAGAEFFGIEMEESKNLFLGGQYKVSNTKPRHVIAKVKKLIKKYEVGAI